MAETLFTDILTRLRPGYKDAGIVTKQKRITAAEAIKKLISEDKPISFKNIADKTGVPKTTVTRVYNEQFKNKGTLAKSGNAKKITQEIIDSGITDVNKIKQIAKQKYNIQLANRSVQQAVNIATDLSVGEYENMFKKMATDRTYEPPVDISAKGKGLSANYKKAKANVTKEIPQLQKLITQNSTKRKTIKRDAKRKVDPDLQNKYLAERQTSRDTKRFKEKGKIKLNSREIGLNKQQRFLLKEANDLINQNPKELLKDKKLLDRISFRVDNEGNIYKSTPDLKAVLDPKKDSRFFHLSHARRAELGTELTDSPANRFASTFNQNNEFIKDAERFIESNPKDPKVKNIIKKAEELKLTLRPDVPKGTFKNKYLGYTKDLDKPVGKIKTVINTYMPKGLKSKLSTVAKAAKIIGKPIARTVGAVVPFVGPAMVGLGAYDVAKAAEQGATGPVESALAYGFGPEAAVGLMNLKAKAQRGELPNLADETDFTSFRNGGIVAAKGVNKLTGKRYGR
jgi:hypothetical protein